MKRYGSLIFAILVLFNLTSCFFKEDSEEKQNKQVGRGPHKMEMGGIQDYDILVPLARTMERTIESLENIENVIISEDYIFVEKGEEYLYSDGSIRRNIYKVTGNFYFNNKEYDFAIMTSFDNLNLEGPSKVLIYRTSFSDLHYNTIDKPQPAK